MKRKRVRKCKYCQEVFTQSLPGQVCCEDPICKRMVIRVAHNKRKMPKNFVEFVAVDGKVVPMNRCVLCDDKFFPERVNSKYCYSKKCTLHKAVNKRPKNPNKLLKPINIISKEARICGHCYFETDGLNINKCSNWHEELGSITNKEYRARGNEIIHKIHNDGEIVMSNEIYIALFKEADSDQLDTLLRAIEVILDEREVKQENAYAAAGF